MMYMNAGIDFLFQSLLTQHPPLQQAPLVAQVTQAVSLISHLSANRRAGEHMQTNHPTVCVRKSRAMLDGHNAAADSLC